MSETLTGVRCSLSAESLLPIRDALPRLIERGFAVRWDGSYSAREICLDTTDRRFRRAGYSLALREDGARTDLVLEPCIVQHDRPALRISAPFAGAGRAELDLNGLPGNIGEAVRAVTGRARLGTVGHREVRRQSFGIARRDRFAGSVTLVEVVGHAGDATDADRRVELDMASREDLSDFLAVLGASMPRSRGAGSKPAGAGDSRSRRQAAAHRSIADAAFVVMRRELARCLQHEPGSRLGVDPEELHDMRVAVRRLEAALRLHRKYLPRGWRPIFGEVRWLGAVLGPVRDLDVQMSGFGERARELCGEDLPGIRAIESALRARRETCRREMLEALDSERYEQFVQHMTAWLADGPGDRPKRGRRRADRIAPRLIRGRMRKLLRAGASLRTDSSAEDLHRLRILGKRARYALEFHADLYGKPARRTLRRLIRLQDLLGEHQDLVAFANRMTALLDATPGPTDQPLRNALERLRCAQLARAEALRHRSPEEFAAFRDPAWRKLRRALRRGSS